MGVNTESSHFLINWDPFLSLKQQNILRLNLLPPRNIKFNSLPFSRLSNLFFEIRSGWKMEAVGIYWKLGKKCVKAFTMNKVKRNDRKDRALEVNSWRGNNNISEENFEFSCWAKFSKGTYHKPWSDNIVLLYTRHRCQNCFSYRHWQQTPDYRYIFYLSVWEVLLGFTRT